MLYFHKYQQALTPFQEFSVETRHALSLRCHTKKLLPAIPRHTHGAIATVYIGDFSGYA